MFNDMSSQHDTRYKQDTRSCSFYGRKEDELTGIKLCKMYFIQHHPHFSENI